MTRARIDCWTGTMGQPIPNDTNVVKVLEWITQSSTRIFALHHVDEKISAALKTKGRKGNFEIQYYTLIGKSFVDGLMHKDKDTVEGHERQEIVFAIH
jgi:hypothetical protein